MNGAFAADLARYGPGSRYRPLTRGEARAYCAHLTRSHYENFSVASLLLPRHLRRHFQAVYAYCRWADDLADEVNDSQRSVELLAWWREELEGCYAGTSRHPVMLALHDTVVRFGIPKQPFLDLLVAFEHDQRVQRYGTFAQLLDYCRNSANPVGRLVLYMGEAFDEERAELADQICTGLQLANFWQDVARDLDIGRVYLPEEDRRRFGYPDEHLEQRLCTPAFRDLLRFEVQRTRDLFRQGAALLPRLPGLLRSDVELFLGGGLAILGRIEAAGFDVLSRRPVLTKWDKGRLLAGALWRRLRDGLRLSQGGPHGGEA
jgi:squalene synthase HpnC